MHDPIELFNFKAMFFGHLARLDIENDELAIFCERENQGRCDDELNDRLRVTLITRMLMHLVPSYDLIGLTQSCVDKASGRSLHI